MNIDINLYETIKKSGVDIIFSVPCIMLKGLLEIIEEKEEIKHLPITREEEGVGIAAGAYLGGSIPVILMQNSGLGNSINAIKSLLELYKIPIVFIIYTTRSKVAKNKMKNKLIISIEIERIRR